MKKPNAKNFMQDQLGKFAGKQAFDQDGRPKPGLEKAILNAIEVQRPLVLANLRRLRRKHPEWTAEELAQKLGRDYMNTVTAGGAAVGATAIMPGVGTAAALALSAGITVGFLEATALYVQSIAELHGVTTEDKERAQTLIMAVLLGEDGKNLITQLAAQSGSMPTGPTLSLLPFMSQKSFSGAIADKIKRTFFKKVLLRQGSSFFGRALPFGVGAVIGGVGNHILAKNNIKNTAELFGALPATMPGELVQDIKKLPKKRSEYMKKDPSGS
ncbi:hypothetical protein [Micrococcoides hystricis]|uniref:Di-and tripeptidase n=1 Tax=Micrococcoides hystricis TaxID=1572761 RepID=A0ABV6PBY4_9MICC